jgi:hypothetical protein
MEIDDMRGLTRALLITAAIAVSGSMWAQAADPQGVEIRNLAPLAFGSFASPASSGQVTVSPDGSRAMSGVIPVGTDAFSAASFEIKVIGLGNPNYVITLPPSITLTSATGTMTIGNVQSFPSGTGNASPPAGVDTLTVGGTLTINAMQQPGSYSATFPVTVHLVN